MGIGDRLWSGLLEFHDVRIATGPVAQDADMAVAIGVVAGSELDAGDFSVYINSKLCIYEGSYIPSQPKPVCKMYSFKVKDCNEFPEASIVEIASAKTEFTVVWIEIAIR